MAVTNQIMQNLDEIEREALGYLTGTAAACYICNGSGVMENWIGTTDCVCQSPARTNDWAARFMKYCGPSIPKLVDALKAVLEEHYPVGEESDCRCCPQECACGVWEYPCVTVKALTKALGVDDA